MTEYMYLRFGWSQDVNTWIIHEACLEEEKEPSIPTAKDIHQFLRIMSTFTHSRKGPKKEMYVPADNSILRWLDDMKHDHHHHLEKAMAEHFIGMEGE